MHKSLLLQVLAAGCLAWSAFAGQGAPAPRCIAASAKSVFAGGTNGVASVFAADVDGDAHVDVLTASFGDDKIAWHRSDGGVVPSFSEHVISTTADSASSVFAADVDGDGDVDVLSASSNDHTIALYENDGGALPGFTERTVSTNARRAQSVFAADLTGECTKPSRTDPPCRLEILSASSQDNKIAWYEEDGESFIERVIAQDAAGAEAVFAADLDGDGDVDVLSASRLDHTIAWYENVPFEPEEGERVEEDDPPISFVAHTISTSVSGATSVLAADINGDGKLDVAAAAGNTDEIVWYVNDGVPSPPTLPTFSVQQIVTTSAVGVGSIFAANVDGALGVDILSASQFDDTVAWYQNNGSGTSWTRHVVTLQAPGARSVFAANLDADADIDILSAASLSGSGAGGDRVTWYENDGTPRGLGDWIARDITTAAVAPEALVVVDLDGDGPLDVVSTSSVDDRVVWYENLGGTSPSFTEHVISTDAGGAVSVFVIDLDQDLDLDVLAASPEDNKLAWYENDAGNWTERIISLNADGAASVHAADIDKDGDPDVLSASSDDNKIAWYENVGTPGGADDWTERLISSTALGARAVIAADIDGDTFLDVVAASALDDRITWFENSGTVPPTFTTRVVNPDLLDPNRGRADGVTSIAAADLDGDRRVDIVSASSNDDKIAWYRNILVVEEAGTSIEFTEFTISRAADFARSVFVADLDADQVLDVVSASSGDDTVAYYTGALAEAEDPPVEFTETVLTTQAGEARSAVAADLNGDTFVDIVTAFRFAIGWHEGHVEEVCGDFDGAPVGGDDRIDGLELIWLGMAFGLSSATPAAEWWFTIDVNGDGMIDGDDLALFTDPGVWGRSADPAAENFCNFTCPP